MKELSIKEKVKRYDEALDKIKRLFGTGETCTKEEIEFIFPELAESKSEKIRKEIIAFLTYYHTGQGNSVKYDDGWIAWLEKQGEHKYTKKDIDDAYLKGVYDADKVEPKFKVGDWVIDKQGIVHQIADVIENVTTHTYGYDIVGGGYFNDNTEGVRLWTIQDAKDGDVLVTPLPKGYEAVEQIFIFKEIKSRDYVNNCIEYYCRVCQGVFYENEIGFMGTTTDGVFHPATKEQRDLLFQKMKEAGYEWDAEKKELKKIEQKPILDVEIPFGAKDSELEEVTYDIPKGYHAEIEDNKVVIKKGEKKPADLKTKAGNWYICDEEVMNENMVAAFHPNEIYYCPKDGYLDVGGALFEVGYLDVFRLATEKEIPQPKQEWSEEDEENFKWFDKFFRAESIMVGGRDIPQDKYLWFKSLRSKSHWKPSDEQMEGIECTIKTLRYQLNAGDNRLDSLYNDLKKLMEE